ncbi:MAG: ROK family protein [Chloroflexi bacterium]|nr:ROK family protein [Chloroflexota bacterium]
MPPTRGGARTMLAGDLGGTRMRLALFTEDGEIAARRRDDTPADRPTALIDAARAALAEAPGAVDAFVLGVAGPTDYEAGRPLRLPNLPGWEGHLSAAGLADALGLPMLIANDADLAALGEHRFGAGRGTRDLVDVTSSTGGGGGVVLNGRLLHGRRSLAPRSAGWRSTARRAPRSRSSARARRSSASRGRTSPP